MTRGTQSAGVLLSLLSTSLFAGQTYYVSWLRPLSGEDVFALRTLLTLPLITLLMVLSQEWLRVTETCRRVAEQPALALGLMCSSTLLGAQLWLFVWAPMNGQALQVSMGYFLLPLSMLLVGRVLYKDHLSRLQLVATSFACLGVAHGVWAAGGLSWVALVVCLGFPAYFVLRKALGLEHLGGLWFDMLLAVPAAAWLVLRHPSTAEAFQHRAALYPLMVGLAIISAVALMSYILASRRLPLSLFGLLGYVEPVLITTAALLLGERIDPSSWPSYLTIWAAVLLLMLESVLNQRRVAAS